MNWENLYYLLTLYLEQLLNKDTLWDVLIDKYFPLITVAMIVLTGFFGIIKYYRSKNQQIYERVLSEVYAPLYGYFIKQELYLKLSGTELEYKDYPIIELPNVKETNQNGVVSREVTYFCELKRKEFFKILKKTNTGLASKELLTLLNMYKMIIEVEEKFDVGSEIWKRATVFKVNIENAIREEILIGIDNKYKKLGIKSINSGLWEQDGAKIIFNLDIDKRVKKLNEDLLANPQKYEKVK